MEKEKDNKDTEQKETTATEQKASKPLTVEEAMELIKAMNADRQEKASEVDRSKLPDPEAEQRKEYAEQVKQENSEIIRLALKEKTGKLKIKNTNAGKLGLIGKAAPNSQLSSGAGSGLQPVQMGPYIDSLNPYGYISQNAFKVPITQSVMTLPYTATGMVLTGGTELVSMANSNPVLGYVTLTETPYWALAPYSKQLAKHSHYDARTIINSEVMIAADSTVDALYKARVVAQPTSNKMSSSAAAAGVSLLTTQTFADAVSSSTNANKLLYGTIGLLAGNNLRYVNNASIKMHPQTMYHLAAISDVNNSGKRLIEWDAQGTPRFNGIRIDPTNAFSAPTVALTSAGSAFFSVDNTGDAVVHAEGESLELEVFETGTANEINLLTQYAEAFRCTYFMDLQLKVGRSTWFGA